MQRLYFRHMEERAETGVGFSHMATLAAFSAIALLGVSGWQIYQVFVRGNPVNAINVVDSSTQARASTPYGSVNWQAPPASASGEPAASELEANDPDGISNIEGNVARALLSSYVMLNEAGIYTPEDGEKIASDIATSLRANVAYKTYTAADIKTDSNVSYDRMLAYRNDLRIALEPLLGNPGYELGLFANYIGSNDQKYMEQLKTASENYRKAVAQTAAVTVPEDAVEEHVGVLNALSEFGTVVERMAGHADDAFAAAALLQTYNTAEQTMMTSFNALALYQKGKKI